MIWEGIQVGQHPNRLSAEQAFPYPTAQWQAGFCRKFTPSSGPLPNSVDGQKIRRWPISCIGWVEQPCLWLQHTVTRPIVKWMGHRLCILAHATCKTHLYPKMTETEVGHAVHKLAKHAYPRAGMQMQERLAKGRVLWTPRSTVNSETCSLLLWGTLWMRPAYQELTGMQTPKRPGWPRNGSSPSQLPWICPPARCGTHSPQHQPLIAGFSMSFRASINKLS